MQPLDLDLMADNVQYTDRPTWDTARILAMYSIAPYTKKSQKIQDLFPLPWDEEQYDFTEDNFKAHMAAMQQLAQTL